MTTPLPSFVDDELFIGTTTVAGREMQVKAITDAQFMVLTHEATLLQNPNVDKPRKIKAVDRVYRVFTSIIVNEEDIEFVQDSLAEGNLGMGELANSLLEVRVQQAKAASGINTKGPVKARRGRTTKS